MLLSLNQDDQNMNKQVFFAKEGMPGSKAPASKPPFHKTASADVLTGADENQVSEGVRKRNGKKGNFEEFKMSSESDTFFDIARSVGDNHTTLSQYVADAMKLFKGVDTCSIYLADKISRNEEDDTERTILRHRVTVEMRDDGSFWTRNVDPQHTITRCTQNELVAFMKRKPTIYNFRKGFKLEFRNLQRGNRRYDHQPQARRPGKNEMVAHIPIIYRNKPIGLLVIEGNLDIALEEKGPRLVSAIKEKFEDLSAIVQKRMVEKNYSQEALSIIGEMRSEISELQAAVPELIDDPSELAKRTAARVAAIGIGIGAVLGEKLVTKFGGVTELPGKEDFRIDLEEALKKLEDGKIRTLFVLMIDLDHFKITNDTYGHLKGDILLRKVADILRESVRTRIKKTDINDEDGAGQNEPAEDPAMPAANPERRSSKSEEKKEAEPDNIARWGGEEFTVLLTDVDYELALKITKRIIKAVSEIRIPLDPEKDQVKVNGQWVPAKKGEEIRSSCSIGAADVACVLRETKLRSIRKRAACIVDTCDKLMYRAKSEGRNRIYSTEMRLGKLNVVEYKNGSS